MSEIVSDELRKRTARMWHHHVAAEGGAVDTETCPTCTVCEAADVIDEAADIVRAFVVETTDYMFRNRLGDPFDQHNVKRATEFLARLNPPESDVA